MNLLFRYVTNQPLIDGYTTNGTMSYFLCPCLLVRTTIFKSLSMLLYSMIHSAVLIGTYLYSDKVRKTDLRVH